MEDSGSFDPGSNPGGVTLKLQYRYKSLIYDGIFLLHTKTHKSMMWFWHLFYHNLQVPGYVC